MWALPPEFDDLSKKAMCGLNKTGVPRVPGTNWFKDLTKRDQFHFAASDASYIAIADLIVTSVSFLRHELALRALSYHAMMAGRDRAAERLAAEQAEQAAGTAAEEAPVGSRRGRQCGGRDRWRRGRRRWQRRGEAVRVFGPQRDSGLQRVGWKERRRR